MIGNDAKFRYRVIFSKPGENCIEVIGEAKDPYDAIIDGFEKMGENITGLDWLFVTIQCKGWVEPDDPQY